MKNSVKKLLSILLAASMLLGVSVSVFAQDTISDDLDRYLEEFNNGKINHITACNMLNECMNLVNCQVGIYANLNNSETIIKQRLGKL